MQRSLSAGLVADGGAVYDAAEVPGMATPGLAVLGRQVATGQAVAPLLQDERLPLSGASFGPAGGAGSIIGDHSADGGAFLAFPLQELAPAELHGVLCDFVWDSDKLQRLPLPVGTATVDSLRWHLHLPYWCHDGKPFRVTPTQVKADPACYQEQYKRTMAADLGYPLVLLYRNSRWVILDGVHRLLKADVFGLSHVRVQRLPATMLPLILQKAT